MQPRLIVMADILQGLFLSVIPEKINYPIYYGSFHYLYLLVSLNILRISYFVQGYILSV